MKVYAIQNKEGKYLARSWFVEKIEDARFHGKAAPAKGIISRRKRYEDEKGLKLVEFELGEGKIIN